MTFSDTESTKSTENTASRLAVAGPDGAESWPESAGRAVAATAPRGRVRADRVYVGWQHIDPGPDPGRRPRLPGLAEPDGISAAWVAAQRREHTRLARPARLTCAAGISVAVAVVMAWLAGLLPAGVALLATGAAVYAGSSGALSIWRDNRALAAQLQAEELRVAGFAAMQRRELAARQEKHAREVRAWKLRSTSLRGQPQWYPVTLPTTVHRVDVAGGTLTGWSALVTMIAAARLAAGGDVTVLDLTEGGVATDLLTVARQTGIGPQVWVLPADLPQLELGTLMPPDVLGDVLAQTVSAADGPGGATGATAGDPARDAALLGGVLQALGVHATMPQLIAGLRVLGQIGGPAEHLVSGELTHDQLAGLSNLAGRGAAQLLTERAWSIEARLRVLAPLGTAVGTRPPSRLKIVWLDRRAASVANAVLAAYLVIALTATLRQAPPGRRWQQTICLLGAERLPGVILDRLSDAAETSGAGLVLGYRSIPAHVRERLGRGDAAVGFMRLGNAEDARIAAEQIGTEHRFLVSQLTDTIGTTLTDTVGGSYTSTVGTADSVTGSDSVTTTTGRSRSRSRPGAVAPFADLTGSASRDQSSSAAVCDSQSITAGISSGTSWGWSTSKAIGSSDSAARTSQRSRESLVEQHELQQLPQSALLLCYPAPEGRQVLLADANPAIMALPTATLAACPPGFAQPAGGSADSATRPGSSARM
jgi:hypothetical protein